MRIETLKERISNAEQKISKKQNTIAKKTALIEKKNALIAKTEDDRERKWIACEIESLQDDIERLAKEVKEAQESLDKYTAQLIAEEEKAASRNVTAIIKFLENWKARVTDYYHERFPEFLEAREARYADNRQYCDYVNGGWRKEFDNWKDAHTAIEEKRKAEREKKRKFISEWGFIMPYIIRHGTFDDEKLAEELKHEAECKYDDIIERTNAICGKITDARGLWVGDKGDLDGIVIGERGTAKVQTIGAGGYNIQCYHFRTLVHKIG